MKISSGYAYLNIPLLPQLASEMASKTPYPGQAILSCILYCPEIRNLEIVAYRAPVRLLLQRCRRPIVVLVDSSKGEAATVEDYETEGERNGEALEEHPHLDDARPRQATALRDIAAGEGAASAHRNSHQAHELGCCD